MRRLSLYVVITLLVGYDKYTFPKQTEEAETYYNIFIIFTVNLEYICSDRLNSFTFIIMNCTNMKIQYCAVS